MIRRILLVAAAAVALVLVPSAAMAYNAPGYSSSVSDSTPTAGSPVTVTVHANPNEAIRLVVTSAAGVKTYNGMTNASGVATYTFNAGPAGITTVQAFNAAGKLVSDQTLTVGAAAAISHSGNNSGAGAGGGLSNTGFEGMPLAIGGGVLVLAGAGAVIVTRRRRSAQVTD